MEQENIHPTFERILQRSDKEAFLGQRAAVFWFTGLSGSGKTSIAVGLEKELNKKSILTQVLDGDNIRSGINRNLGFSEEDRMENIRRIAEVSKLFLECGVVTINCFVSPTGAMRKMAKDIIGAENFYEVFVNTPIEECEKRDVKGLYKKARKGEITNFTGIHEVYENPENPSLEIKTVGQSLEESVQLALKFALTIVK
ncbi:MAG: adenylyl-sulfate kinase [Vicingaceae bacterium]